MSLVLSPSRRDSLNVCSVCSLRAAQHRVPPGLALGFIHPLGCLRKWNLLLPIHGIHSLPAYCCLSVTTVWCLIACLQRSQCQGSSAPCASRLCSGLHAAPGLPAVVIQSHQAWSPSCCGCLRAMFAASGSWGLGGWISAGPASHAAWLCRAVVIAPRCDLFDSPPEPGRLVHSAVLVAG